VTTLTRQQLYLPLLDVIDELGGRPTAKQAAAALAVKLDIPMATRALTGNVDRGCRRNLFDRTIRWARQDLVRRGLLSAEERNAWTLTDKGTNHLRNCRPGIVVTIYETENGVALWADATTAAAVIEDSSIQLIITSPPYDLVTPKHYGNLNGKAYLDWLTGLAAEWKRMLVDDGSLVLNLGDVWEKGQPTVSLYQERLLLRLVDDLGYHLAQKVVWHNPAKIPSSDWVTVKRVRIKNAVENFYWLGKGRNPKADNRRILKPYTQRMTNTIAAGGETRRVRPGGHGDTRGSFGRDNGGTIPSNMFEATNAKSNDAYCRGCREQGLPIHPARYPDNIPAMFVKMLTDPGDTVADFFGGSGSIGEVCECLGRRWITSERSLTYIEGSRNRFPQLAIAGQS